MNFKTALKTAALATALAFASTSHAEVKDAYKHDYNGGGMASVSEGDQALSGFGVQGVAVYDMTNLANATQTMLAFCIAPNDDLIEGANYFATYNVNLNNRFGERGSLIKALFETSYGALSSDDSKVAFQLVLWDLEVDNGKIESGDQRFALTDDPTNSINLAYGMLSTAKSYLASGGTLNTYTYTTFSTDANAPLSQELMGASIAAVPEADTWAMLVAGLGLVGLVGRRRAKQSEKFAA